MRKSIEIQRDLNAELAAVETLSTPADIDAANARIENLNRELSTAILNEDAERLKAHIRTFSPEEKKEAKRFSISKYIREAASNRLSGFEAEMNEEGLKEFRDSARTSERGFVLPSIVLDTMAVGRRTYDNNNSQTSTEGAEFVTRATIGYQEGLRNAMIMARLGATYMTGLRGNVRIVKGGAAAASWYVEEGAASTTKLAFGTLDLSPKRLQIIAGYTGELLHQSTLAVDEIIARELVMAHASALDAAAINGTGSSGQPAGILNTVGIGSVAMGDDGGAITYAALVNLEKEVSVDNALLGNLAYVTNSKVAAKLKTIPTVAGYPNWIMEGGQANGYPVVICNAVPSTLTKGNTSGACSAVIFGNFQDVIIAQWGGMDLLIDPFTSKGKGVVEVSAAAYHDIGVRHPESFAAIKDVTTV